MYMPWLSPKGEFWNDGAQKHSFIVKQTLVYFGIVEKRFYPTSRDFLSDLMVVNSLSFLCIVMLLSPCFTNPPVIDLCTSQKPFLTYPDRYFTIIEIFNEGDGIFP